MSNDISIRYNKGVYKVYQKTYKGHAKEIKISMLITERGPREEREINIEIIFDS
jgi:hypothetical protein